MIIVVFRIFIPRCLIDPGPRCLPLILSAPLDSSLKSPGLTFTPPKRGSSFRPFATKAKPTCSRVNNGLKGMKINCNGLKGASRRIEFQALLDLHQPDIVLGCESKLDKDIPTPLTVCKYLH